MFGGGRNFFRQTSPSRRSAVRTPDTAIAPTPRTTNVRRNTTSVCRPPGSRTTCAGRNGRLGARARVSHRLRLFFAPRARARRRDPFSAVARTGNIFAEHSRSQSRVFSDVSRRPARDRKRCNAATSCLRYNRPRVYKITVRNSRAPTSTTVFDRYRVPSSAR